MLFVKSEFERVRPSGDQGREFVAQSARKWRGMSMAEKKVSFPRPRAPPPSRL